VSQANSRVFVKSTVVKILFGKLVSDITVKAGGLVIRKYERRRSGESKKAGGVAYKTRKTAEGKYQKQKLYKEKC